LAVLLTNFRSPWDPLAGGGQTATDDLARALHAAGHDVQALFAGAPPSAPRHPYPVRWVRPRARPWALALALAHAVREQTRQRRFDVIHTTGFEGGLIRAPVPRVATLHSPELPEWRPPSPARPLRLLRYLRAHVGPALERRCLRAAAATVFVSDHSRRRAAERGYPVREGVVIPNGVDPETFRPEAGSRAQRPTILFVGRFDDQKGIDVLLDAWRGLQEAADLRLAGTGWREDRYREQARQLGLRSVHWDGHVARERLPELVRRAWAVVLPSRYENFPLVLLEAMACGVPVVATRVGGIPELVTDGVEGLLVPAEDAPALREALAAIVRDGARASGMGARARRRIEGRYTWDIIAAQMAALYARVAAGATTSHPPR
jgi:glycosyltransferase involved in cell wall biosynthesis